MILLLLKIINKFFKFNTFSLVVVPYAIGTICEHLLFVSLSKKEVERILLFSPYLFQKKLNYQNFVLELSKAVLFKNKKLNEGIFFKFFNFLLSVEFAIYRLLMTYIFFAKKPYFWENYNETFADNPNVIFENIDEKSIDTFNIIKSSNFSIDKKIEENCKKKFKNYNIDIESDFICLHVRDDNFHNDQGRRDFRNSNIDNYLEMINFFKEKNFKVFRMGLKANKKLKNADNIDIIDYPFSDFNSREFDFFLAKNCKFHIAGGGGFTQLPNLFNKPCLYTNDYTIYNEIPLNSLSRKVFKKIKHKESNNYLNFIEYLNLPYEYHHISYKYEKLKFEENSSEELVFFGKEFFETIQKEEKLSPIQLKFNRYILDKYKFMLKEFGLNKDNKKNFHIDDIRGAYARLGLLKIMKGSFSNNFLKKNFIS